jgi:hypothetical protein
MVLIGLQLDLQASGSRLVDAGVALTRRHRLAGPIK